MCIESGVVFLSSQKSNPKVWVYREKFNTMNFPQTFSSGLYICWDYVIQFSHHFPMKIFSPSPPRCPVHFSKVRNLRKNIYEKLKNLNLTRFFYSITYWSYDERNDFFTQHFLIKKKHGQPTYYR